MKIGRQLWIVALSLLAGCASHGSRVMTASAPTEKNYPVIMRMVGRHQTVTINAGPATALYSVQAANGATLVSNVTLEELRNAHPTEFKLIEPVVAADHSDAFAGLGSAE